MLCGFLQTPLTCNSYVVSTVEALLVFGISSYFRTISFQETNLVERVGLLTLIILGEGIIGVIRAVGVVLFQTDFITPKMFALSFAALMVLVSLVYSSYGFRKLTSMS